eukprot:1371076-Rhodomonas_salina.2
MMRNEEQPGSIIGICQYRTSYSQRGSAWCSRRSWREEGERGGDQGSVDVDGGVVGGEQGGAAGDEGKRLHGKERRRGRETERSILSGRRASVERASLRQGRGERGRVRELSCCMLRKTAGCNEVKRGNPGERGMKAEGRDRASSSCCLCRAFESSPSPAQYAAPAGSGGKRCIEHTEGRTRRDEEDEGERHMSAGQQTQ